MSVLIIGYGSIGARHAKILSQMHRTVSLITRQKIENYTCYETIEKAFKENVFNMVVIENPTNLHYETLKKIYLLNFQGIILVEKPLFSNLEAIDFNVRENVYVAYNLRFHELFNHLIDILKDDALLSFSVHAGSYLPDWRKNTNYQNCYSAKQEQGGGVLRDLSHELDYILWICGKCIEVTAMGGHMSSLEINSDDIYSILMRCENCPIVNIQLDYLSRVPMRNITIQTKKQKTIFIDLINGCLSLNGEILFNIKEPIKNTYILQHKAIIEKNFADLCCFKQGLAVMNLISMIEKSACEKKWVVL